jgi:hypothetical protein
MMILILDGVIFRCFVVAFSVDVVRLEMILTMMTHVVSFLGVGFCDDIFTVCKWINYGRKLAHINVACLD